MNSSWPYYWKAEEDALYIWNDKGVLVAKIPSEHFAAMVADIAEQVKWREAKRTKP